MAKRLVKQPNGRYGLFSDIVDMFVFVDIPESEASEKWQNKKASADKDEIPEEYQFLEMKEDGLNRWRHSLATIQKIHGKEARDRVVAMVQT